MTNNLNRSRRAFLEFAGKSGISGHALKGSSLLAGLLANRYAHANQGVKRVVFVYTPLGSPNGLWLPRDNRLNEATAAFEGLQSVCHFREANVVNGGFGMLWKALSEARYVPDWTSDSIDHQMAKVLGVSTPFPSLHLGVQSTLTGSPDFSFTRKNLQQVVPMEGPHLTYERLFGSAAGELPDHFKAHDLKRNVLDAHLHSLNCSRAKLSSDEISAVDQYEASLGELKRKLSEASAIVPACRRPEWNAHKWVTQSNDGQERGIFAHEAYLQSEIISHAFACGLTNVATLQLSDDEGSFTGHDTVFKLGMHSATCSVSGSSAYVELTNYLGRCVAYLIHQLAEQDDPAVPGTKLLDNTVVVQVSNQGNGPDHTGDRGPNLIATKMPSFKTGLATPQSSNDDVNLRVLQAVAVGLGLEQYIGKEDHHCIWPCGDRWGGIDDAILT